MFDILDTFSLSETGDIALYYLSLQERDESVALKFKNDLVGVEWFIIFLSYDEWVNISMEYVFDDCLYIFTLLVAVNKDDDIINLLTFITYYYQRVKTSKNNYICRIFIWGNVKLFFEKLNLILLHSQTSRNFVNILFCFVVV